MTARLGLPTLALTALPLGGALFFGEGSRDDPLLAIGAAAVLIGLAGCLAAALGALPRPALGGFGLAALGLLAAFVVWSACSILWSIAPDRSWAFLNRGLVYLAFVLLGVGVGTLVPRATRRAAVGFALLLGLVLAWALAGKVVPGLDPDGATAARLRGSVGYGNALALLAAVALPLALWLASRRAHAHGLRAGGVVLLVVASLSLLLTLSRGGVLIGVLAVLAWLALSEERLESIVALLLAAPVVAALGAFALTRPGLVEDGVAEAVRERDGARFGVALVLGLSLVSAAAWLASRLQARRPLAARRRSLGRRLAVGAAAVALLGVAGLAAAGETPAAWLREFASSDVAGTDPARFGSGSSNNRWSWWGEAWESFGERPLEGWGAASFELTHERLRQDSQVTREPHSLPLQFLSELGAVGFLLAGAASLAAALAVRASLRGLGPGDRAPAIALAVGVAAYGLHALVDFPYDFVAVSAPVALLLGLLLAVGRPPRPATRGPLPALAALAAAPLALISLGAPWLAERRIDEATEVIALDPAAAVEKSEAARRLNPLSLEPHFTRALAESVRGRPGEARRAYERAVRLQPRNGATWYRLGVHELGQLGDATRAYTHLNESYTLDRYGRPGRPGGPLDRARCLVDPENASCRR